MANRIQVESVDLYVLCLIRDGEKYTFIFDRAHYMEMSSVVGRYGRSSEFSITEQDAKIIQSGIIDVMESIDETKT